MQGSEILSTVVDCLPREFTFYHLGEVKLEGDADPLVSQFRAIGFQFQGDLNGVFVLLFDPELDESVYSELGNTLASKLVTDLSRSAGLDVLISPPRTLSEGQLDALLNSDFPRILKSYFHRYGDRIISLKTLILPTSEGVANA